MPTPPLQGLRVLELADGIAGPYAGRLLAMLGATVAKVEPDGGDPARWKQLDDTPLTGDSPLYWHLNAGKRNVSTGTVPLDWADLVVANRTRAELAGTELDPERLRGRTRLVTVSAWGFESQTAGTIDDEPLVQARSGVIGTTGDPGAAPLRFPGWQAQYFAGACAAVGALSLLRMPDRVHVDVAWMDCLLPGVELLYADALMTGRRRSPSGAFAPVNFPGGALPCADGFVSPGSFREVDWEMQCLFYGIDGLYDDPRFRTRAARAEHVNELWELIGPWYAERTKREIFQYCLDSPWTVGIVMTGIDALSDPQLEARELLTTLEIHEPPGTVRAPARPFRMPGLPVADQRVRATGEDDGTVADWLQTLVPGPVVGRSTRRRFDQIRLIELTTAWAGPFVGNMLGQMGMDVVKFEAQRPFEGYRVLRLFADGDRDDLAHLKTDNRWFEVSAMHNAVNRGKQCLVANLNHADGRQVFLDLVAKSDAVLCNFTTRVMPQLGLSFDDLVAVNPDIVLVRMPAFGTTGPYADGAGYATIVEAMGGFSARFGYEAPTEGARVSATYWPDAVAGVHAALAVLTGLERRDRAGAGVEVDFSHMDVMWCQMAEGILTADHERRDLGRMGNREPGVAVSGIFPCRDGRWVAVIGGPETRSLVERSATMDPDEFVGAIVATADGNRAEIVNGCLDVAGDARFADRFETVDHPVTGPVLQVRAPFVIDGERCASRGPAPMFDQHTDAVLSERLGYTAERIRALRNEKVVGGTLPTPW